MNTADRPTAGPRRALDRRRHRITPFIESLEQRLQLSLVAATAATQITNGADGQTTPAIAMDAAGDYVVVWEDGLDIYGETSAIEAEVFNPNGMAKTGIITVNSSPTPNLTTRNTPSVAMDANGDFVVAWQLLPPNAPPSGTGYYYDIVARRFNLSGTAVGNEFTVAGQTAYPNQLQTPTVAMDASSFVIGWDRGGGNSSTPLSIQAQRYSFSGSTTTPVGSTSTVASTNQPIYPSVAMDTAGDFVFTWDSNNPSYSVLAQIFNSSGVAQGSAISVGSTTEEGYAPVAINGAGHFAVAYLTVTNQGTASEADVFHAHQYALAGTESSLSTISLSGDVTVRSEGYSTSVDYPSVGIDAQGFATITSSDFATAGSTSANDAIDAIRLNPDGSIIESSPIQVAAPNSSEALLTPRVAVGPGGNAAFTWDVFTTNGQPGQRDQIAERLFNYINDAPVIATPANQKIVENGSTTVSLSGITAGTVINGGNEEQTLTVTASSSNTALIVPTVTYTSPNSTGTLNLNPVAGQFGTATITVTVTDSGGTANGGVNSTSVQFTLTVTGKPSANAQSVTVPFNTAKAITLTGSDPNTPPLSLTYALVAGSGPSHGTLTGTAPNLTYTPTAGYQGTDSFQFTTNDGTATSSPATVSITVTPGTPTANAQTVAVPHDSSGTPITLTGSDPDVPALTLTYAFTQPSHGTVTVSGAAGSPTVTYTPAAGYHGSDSFTFTANNGSNTSNPATVTLNVAVGTPAANPQAVSTPQNTAVAVTLTGSDDDVPVLTLTYAVATGPAHGTLSGTAPHLTYTPAAGYSGPDSFSFTLSNGTNTSAPATVSITVAAPTVATVAGTLGVTWGSAGTATLLTDADGLRLLPSGRTTDIPWLGIKTLAITLSQPETLLPSEVSLTGIAVAGYPVTISGSGTNYTITLLQPIDAADRVTLSIAGANLAGFTRRLDVLPGDVNDDGLVNAQDVALDRNMELGLTVSVSFGDVLGDGTVDLADYTEVRKLVGTTLPPIP